MASGLAKEAGDALIAGSYGICSNRRSGKDKCGDGETPTARDRVFSKEPICHECEQEGK